MFSNWFTYNTYVEPRTDRIYSLRTADNRYAKLVIYSYYQTTTDMVRGGYYTFRYAYQPGGSKDLKYPD